MFVSFLCYFQHLTVPKTQDIESKHLKISMYEHCYKDYFDDINNNELGQKVKESRAPFMI